jgi:hypothetical protein
MGLKMMVFANGKTGLAAVCDVCKRHVTEAEEANLVWFPPPTGDKVGDAFEPLITCKDECTRKLEFWAESKGKEFAHLYSQELNVGLVWLLQNSGLMPLGGKKMKEAKRLADLLGSIS